MKIYRISKSNEQRLKNNMWVVASNGWIKDGSIKILDIENKLAKNLNGETVRYEISKMGRPIVGKRPKNLTMTIRMDEEEKAQLKILSEEKGLSISRTVNQLIKKEWEKRDDSG